MQSFIYNKNWAGWFPNPRYDRKQLKDNKKVSTFPKVWHMQSKKHQIILFDFLTGLNLEVELLVRAHECHTLACNMEGIAAVLRNGRVLTMALAETRDYMLMVTCYSVPWNIKFTNLNKVVNFVSLIQSFVKVITRLCAWFSTLLLLVSLFGL